MQTDPLPSWNDGTSRRSILHFVENERHPTLGLAYRECIYQPMLELLRYLEANGFTNYIVSGGGREFMRGFAQDLYGIPASGSSAARSRIAM